MPDPLAHYAPVRPGVGACGASAETWLSDAALFIEVRPERRCEICLTRAQDALSGRCAAHGLWSCTACAPPGPTLAEMVGRLRDEAAIMNRTNEARAERGAAPAYTVPDVRRAEQLATALAEIDRRLTALEGRSLTGEKLRQALEDMGRECAEGSHGR